MAEGECLKNHGDTSTSPSVWSKSAEEQAADFLDVLFHSTGCSSDLERQISRATGASYWSSQAGDEQQSECQNVADAAPPDPAVLLVAGVDRTMHVRLLIGMILLGIVAPAVLFCLLTPLMLNGLSMELWHIYFCGVKTLLGLCFAELLSRACFGEPAGWCFLGGMWLLGNASCFGALFITDARISEAVRSVSLIATIMLPTIRVAVLSTLQRRHPFAPEAFHLLGLLWMSTPALVSSLLYALLWDFGWGSSRGAVAACVVLWTSVPILLVKPIGAWLFTRGAPAGKFMGALYWSVFSDMAFGTLGLLLFVRSNFSSASYMLAVIPALLLCLLRGLRCSYRCSHRVEQLHLHRLGILLEALSAVLGRLAAYTLYLAAALMKLVLHSQHQDQVKAREVQFGGGSSLTQTMDFFNRIGTEEAQIDINAAGVAVTSLAFAIFCWSIPRFWYGGVDWNLAYVRQEPTRSHELSELPFTSPMPVPEEEQDPGTPCSAKELRVTKQATQKSKASQDSTKTQLQDLDLEADMFYEGLRGKAPPPVGHAPAMAWSGQEDAPPESKASLPALPHGRSWLPGEPECVWAEQSQILSAFLQQQWRMLLAIVLFQFVSSITAVELTHSLGSSS